MKYLEERKVGYNVGVGTVPSCQAPSFSISPSDSRQSARMLPWATAPAYRQARAVAQGNVGAGTGAGIGGDHDPATASRMMKGGLGTASEAAGGLIVGALVVVNCLGNVIDPATGEVLAGLLDEGREGFAGHDGPACYAARHGGLFPGQHHDRRDCHQRAPGQGAGATRGPHGA